MKRAYLTDSSCKRLFEDPNLRENAASNGLVFIEKDDSEPVLAEAVLQLVDVLRDIKEWLNSKRVPEPSTNLRASPPTTKNAEEQAKEIVADYECPKCGGRMVARKAKATGEWFAGCANYPECRGTRNMIGLEK